ncbi:hypothetical protein NXS15_00640 [Mycoplasma sp. CSL7475-4]|uniref:MnuA family membrane nuclease n=1 Tax=Mycoplasma sp. CSL7475-4 TaxID=2973942 RepID=UPI00216B03E1|nr:hypothetical protein [Mycoplasma sp. CSL7475-4]MCS4536639.1 hypothetical protein [Mycoplasma sp. CSL7475-4]
MTKNKLKFVFSSLSITTTPLIVISCKNNQDINNLSIKLKTNIDKIHFNEIKSNSFELLNNNKNIEIMLMDKETLSNGDIRVLYQLKDHQNVSNIKELVIPADKIIKINEDQPKDSVVSDNDQNKDDNNQQSNPSENTETNSTEVHDTDKSDANASEETTATESNVTDNKEEKHEQPDTNDNDNINNGDSKNFIRIASWNVLNFGSRSVKYEPKGQAIASIIYTQDYDVVGVTELDSEEAIKQVVNLLNEIDTKHSVNNDWKYIISDEYPIAEGHKNQADKHAGFIYKNTVVSPALLQNNQYKALYNNSNFENKFGGSLNGYSRPPFTVKFNVNLLKYKNNNFTYLVSHFDGPGVNEGEISVSGGNGSGEFNEAWNIKNAFEWAKTINNGDDDLIFQGDTNIELKNQSQAFGWVNDYNAQIVFDDDESNATSLKRSYGKYSQPYDKIIHSSNLKYTNPKIYHLYDFVNDPSIFQFSKISSLEEWIEYCSQISGKKYQSEIGYIYSGVSDHSPISYDLVLDVNDQH